MAYFGLPGTDTSEGGEFLSRIQFDARVGFWKTVKRVQQGDGSWGDEATDPFGKPTLAIDFGTLEVGFIKFASPPAFVVVPYGSAVPVCPEEMGSAPDGKPRKAFQPGFRVKVYNPKLFGDADAYYFSNTSKAVMEPMDGLHQKFLAAPEARTGKIPVVAVTGNRTIENTTSRGTTKFYSPIFEIKQWIERPACFGDRTVPAPGAAAAKSNGAAVAKTPARHVPPPADDEWGAPMTGPAPSVARGPAPDMSDLDDTIPF